MLLSPSLDADTTLIPPTSDDFACWEVWVFLQAMQIFRGWFVNGVFLVLGMMMVIALLNIAKLRIQKWSPEYAVAMVRALLWSVWQNQACLMRDAVRTRGFHVGKHVGGFYCDLVAKSVGNLITLKQLKMYFSLWSLKVNTLEKGLGLTSTSVWYSWKNSAFWVCLWGSLASEVASARYSLWCDLRWNLFTSCLPSECCWAVCARCLPSGTQSDCELEIWEKLLYLLRWSLKGWRLQAWQSSCLVWGKQPGKAKQWHLNYVLKSENLLPDGQDQENIVGRGADMAKAVCLETEVVI